MAGRPARLSGFPVLVRSDSRRRGSQAAAEADRRGDSEPGWDSGHGHAAQEHAGEDPACEDELARLITQVRVARERLARLIANLQAERPDWEEREQEMGAMAYGNEAPSRPQRSGGENPLTSGVRRCSVTHTVELDSNPGRR